MIGEQFETMLQRRDALKIVVSTPSSQDDADDLIYCVQMKSE